MTRQQRLLLASLSAAWVGMVLACGGGGNKPDPPQPQNVDAKDGTEKIIPYEVLDKWNSPYRGDNRIGMYILVSETVSKQEVMKLAENLKREYAGKYIAIHIWNSREAYRRKNADIEDEEVGRHYLVLMLDGQENRWIAEGLTPEEQEKIVKQMLEAAEHHEIPAHEGNKTPEEIAKQRQADSDGQRLLGENAARKKVELLQEAKQFIQDGKAAMAKEQHKEASGLFQKAAEHCLKILKVAPQASAKDDAKAVLEESQSLLKVENDEVKAATKLKLTEQFVADAQKEKGNGNVQVAKTLLQRAQDRYREIIRDYPKTKAAGEAKELLD